MWPFGKKKQAPQPDPRSDGWQNVLSGFGTDRDRRASNEFAGADVVTSAEARELWRGDDLAARIIEKVPDECFRRGFNFEIRADEEGADQARDLAEKMGSWAEELGVAQAFTRALQYERAYGGAAILPVANDLTAVLRNPLNLKSVARVSHLLVFEPRELQPVEWYSSPSDPKFRQPKVWRLVPLSAGGGFVPANLEIHESRLVIFPGIRVSSEMTPGMDVGWGDSVLTRVRHVLADFNLTWASAATLLQDFAQAIYRIQGLADLVSSNQDEVVKKRLQLMDLMRSTVRAILLDGGDGDRAPEEFERKSTSLAGFPEMLQQFCLRLAAAADMPVTLLMGQSPAGMDATGESDRVFFYDRVEAAQTRCKPQLEQLGAVMFAAKMGPAKGVEPEVWSAAHKPLLSPSQKDEVETRNTQAEADKKYIEMGVLMPGEVAKARFGGDSYSYETKLDAAARGDLDAMFSAKPEEAEVGAEGAAPADPLATPEENDKAIAASEGVQAGEVKFFQYELELGIVTLNEVRASKGLGPMTDGELTLPQYKAKHKELFADAEMPTANPEKVLGIEDPPPPPPVIAGPGGKAPPFGRKAAPEGEEPAPDEGEKPRAPPFGKKSAEE